MKQKKILTRMLSIVLAAVLIAPTAWIPAENNAAVSTAASSEVVYVSADDGDDSYAGTAEAPVKTLEKAFEVVANGGTVQIVGTYDGATSWSATGKAITITGETLNFVTGNITLGGLGDTFTFKNITLGFATDQRVFANGCKLTIGEGVVTTSSTDNAPYLYGGCAVAKGSLDGDSYLEVYSGTWKRIYGGGNDASIQSGDTHVIVGGTTTKVYAIYGSGMGDHIYGDTNVTVQGKVTAEYVYGGGSFSHHGTLAIDGRTNVIIADEVNIMSVNGGSNLVRGTDYMSLDVTTYCDTKVHMTGGTVQQVFGGNNTGPMTGDVDVRILGGEVTRRIYGGNYNECSHNILTGETTWNTNYAVNGNIILTIGDEANISLNESSLTDGNDKGIFACSRNNPKSDTEHTTIIYDNEAAYNTYEEKIGPQDSWAESIMSEVDAVDNTHRYEYTANDETNTITATCTLCSEEHSEEATLEAIQDEFIYGGKAIEGAQVTYEEAWSAAPLDIVYANNEAAGTATATCTIQEQSVSVDFKIESTVLYGKTISILGDSISTFGGVSNNANMNSTIGKNNVYYSGGTQTSTGVIWQNQTYWGKVIDKYGMELCVNNSTGSGKVSADVDKGDGYERLSGIKRGTELHNNEGQEPDIIIVYMGTNDLADNTSTSFKSAYKKMIDNIYARYANAEIFCFTLIPRNEQATYETRVTGYNNKIREVVSTYEDRVTLVDMYQELGLTWNNLSLYLRSDNLHPNPTGMEYISKVLERALLNEFDSESYPSTPEVYFDLALDVENNAVSNAVTDQNTTVSKEGDNGVVKNMEYIHEGKTCQIPVYYAPKDASGNSYLDVEFKEVTGQSTDAAKVEKLSSMIFDNGITFECFVWVDGTTDSTAGLMTSMNSGGIGLCSINKGGGTNFQIGSANRAGYGYSYGSKYVSSNHNSNANALTAGKFSHVVGTYDNDTNVMTLYIDGQFIGSGTYGTGSFEKGSSTVGHIGIGTNIAALGESLDDDMNYAFADARVYKGALSQEQVIERYNTFWDEATGSSVYFDLDFQDENGDGVKEPVSVGTNKEKTNIEVKNGGEITTMDVLHEGQICKVPVYSAESVSKTQSTNHKYLDVAFSDIDTASKMGDWLLKDGITFECFLYIEDSFVTGKTVGIMSNCYSGGVTLYNVKGQEGLNFLVGANNFTSESNKYSGTYIGAVKHTEATASGKVQDCSLDEKAITHVVATITVDGDNKMMSLYKNGVLISQGKYTGTFKEGSIGTKGGFGHIGIGANISETSEGLNYYSDYSIVDARIYSYGLTGEQVAAEYENRWNEVASYATVDEVPQLDDLSEYADVTTGNSQELEGLPTYYSGSSTSGIYEGSNSGDRAAGGDGDYTLHVFSDSAQGAYISYLKALEKDGWEQYSNNVKENNLFATYTMDDDKDGIADKSVYAYYIGNKKTTYIIASKTAYLENKAEEYEKVCEPMFTELKNISSSQCEILRLSDGRFIIIDSGMLETDHYQAKNIYKTLKEQNVLNKITIAAWIVTHAHTDHMDACADFLKVYGNAQVEIEEIIFNFPNKADREEADLTNQPYTTPVFFEALAIAQKKWPNMKIITCHTGQEYQIADAKIEILHTPEDYFPTKIADVKDKLNDSSVVFRIKIAGQTIMILGDAGTGASNGVITMWGDYLKSDFVQMSHHGMNGGIVPVYERIDPTVVTIPAVRHLWEVKTHDDYIGQYAPTRWVLDNISGNIKEVCIAGLGTHTFTLPYTPQGENAAIIGAEQNGYVLEEGPKVKADDIPEPYMDLTFDGTGIKDGSTKANNTLEMVGGSVGEQTVYYKGKPYTVTAYRGEKTSSDYHHIKLTMNSISADDATGITELLTGGNGHAFEAFFALDAQATIAGGVISGCYSGGVTIYARKYGVIGYQLGSKNGDANKYIYAADTESTKAINNYTIPFGQTVIHVVATYDEVNHKLNLYRNGVLMSSADYSAEFNAANVSEMAYNTLGIGANIGSTGEAIGRSTGYTIIKSRVYDESLNAEQVAASYWECIKELTGSEDEAIYEQQTVEYTREEANKFLSKGTYPRKDGYLFGGWYTTTDIPEIDVNNYDESVEAALKKVIKTEVPENIDNVYALFVPEDVMTVKAQISGNLLDNDDSNNGTGAIRFVTTVDSLLYKEVGFTVSYMNSSGTPTAVTKASKKVYEKLHAVDVTTGAGIEAEEWDYFPTQFCSVSKYFKACHVYNLSAEKFDREYTVTPYWVTMDGSYVYGEPVVKSISQYPSMLK